ERLEEGARKALDGDPLDYAIAQWPRLWSRKHGILLDDHQVDLLRAVFDPNITEVFVKGCAKAGKDAAAGMAICVWFRLFADAKVIITSSSFDHACRVTFGEVAKWYSSMRDRGPGKLLTTSIVDDSSGARQHYIETVNPDKGEGFSGHHSEHVLFFF